ncbi:MAG: hypothetical protein ACM3WU_05235 [Bacillota bacterium]
MQRSSHFTSLIVVALIVANLVGFVYINRMRAEIAELRSAVSIQAGLRGEVQQLRSEMAALREGMEWATPVDISIDDPSAEAISLVATWQIKDFTEGSSVTFHWQGPEDEGFREIEAEKLSAGRFQAKVGEPVFIVPEVIVSGGFGGDNKQGKVHAKLIAERPVLCTYYISMKTGDSVRTADARTTDLSKVYAALVYGVNLSVAGDSKKMTVAVAETPNQYAKPAFRLESAKLEGYSGSSKVLDLTLVKRGTTSVVLGSDSVDVPVFEAEMPKPVSTLTALWLNLSYSDGKSARLELSPAILQ